MSKIENTKELRAEILDKIEQDGVSLGEFSESQKIRIIKLYAALVLAA